MTKHRKYRKKDSAYKTPEFRDHKTLFAHVDNEELGEDANSGKYILSEDAQVDKFLVAWVKENRPFKNYPGFRRLVDMDGVDEVYLRIKIYYRSYVLKQDWSEEKYTYVLNKILGAKMLLSNAAFTRFGFEYDHGRTPISTKKSDKTSTIYDNEEKQAKITEVLDAWEALEELEDE